MISNKLSYREFETIFVSILSLEPISEVKSKIYKILHYEIPENDDKEKYINSLSTGVKSTYKNFEIEMRKLSNSRNEYTGFRLHLYKETDIVDVFRNPLKRIVQDVQRICEKEIKNGKLIHFNLGRNVKQNEKEWLLYHIETQNSNCVSKQKLSPLSIYTMQNMNSFLMEFLFYPDCYIRHDNKTIIKNNWLDILQTHPSFQEIEMYLQYFKI